jgi:murein DD-endopeptidase MepM/ murein hydrolase activator NlpD
MSRVWRVRLVAYASVMLLFVMISWTARHGQAAPLSQILQPGDVATPTPTYTIILVPTSTPTPAALSPLVNEAVGMHEADTFAQYTVRPGDTLLTVALEVGLDVGDLPCAVSPDFRPDQPLVIGDVLEVPPAGWQCHRVSAEETLTQIATQYGLDSVDLIEIAWNRLDASGLGNSPLVADSYVRVPPTVNDGLSGGFMNFMLDQPLSVSPITAYAIGGTKPRSVDTAGAVVGPMPKDWPYGSGNFMWPVYGWMSQGYRGDHRAIDIAAPPGAFVTAADRGVVIRSGWNDQGYGLFVVVDHNIDYITLYAHLTDVLVKEGDVVAQGQLIGTIGSTGNSTGPHLHFEIRDFGRRANPLDFLIR